MPHSFTAFFLMSTVTSAVLGKTSCPEKQQENLPSLPPLRPFPSFLCEKSSIHLSYCSLRWNGERNHSACLSVCPGCRKSSRSCGRGRHCQHVPGYTDLNAFIQRARCWPEGSQHKAMLHFYSLLRWRDFFFNQLQPCQQLLTAEEELVSIWIHSGNHKQLVDRGHSPRGARSWLVLLHRAFAGSATCTPGEDLRQRCAELTRNNLRGLCRACQDA